MVRFLIVCCLYILFGFNSTFAQEYQKVLIHGIHEIRIVKGWCGNLSISTKVGYMVNNVCHYEKETTPEGYDGCVQFLNGALLENKVGKAYQCGETHIHSQVNGNDVFDNFRLITDKDGDYINTLPYYSEVKI